MESASNMVHHDNISGPYPLLAEKQNQILAVHVFPLPSMELSPALLLMTTTVKLAAGQHLNNVTTSMIFSGMVRGVRGRMSAVTEEDVVL